MDSAPEPAANATDATRPLRFIIAGGINTLFGLAVFTSMASASWPTWVCLLVGNLSGTLFNFVTIGGYVFRDLTRRRLPRFILVYFGVYTLNLVGLMLLQHYSFGRIVAQVLLTAPIAALSYALMRAFVFKAT